MFNLIRWGAALVALALLAWFVYEVFITGEGAVAASGAVPGSLRL